MRELDSTALVLVRVAIAAAVFYLIHKLTSNERITSRRDYMRLALYSLLGVSGNQLFYLYGLNLTTATAAQMLIVAGPAITLLIAILIGREAATRTKWLGIALAASGALVLIGTSPEGGRLGNIVILLNVAGYATYLVIARDILRRYRPLTVITWIFIFGALMLLPIGILPAMRQLPGISTQAWIGIAWIIVFPTVAAYYVIMWALTKVESSLVSTFVYLQPVMTAMLAIPILGERPGARMIPAAALIFAGVAVSIRAGRHPGAPLSPAEQTMVET
jgi:drug/metabolite transporter (DMT)-like permease